MIKFEFKNEDYEINDDWEFVKAGKYENKFKKDMDIVFFNFQPYEGDPILTFVSWLEKIPGLTIKEYKTIDYPEGTVF